MNDVISLVGNIFQGILGDAEKIKSTVDSGGVVGGDILKPTAPPGS